MWMNKSTRMREHEGRLPAFPAARASGTQFTAAPGRKRVLVMDDDPTIRGLLTAMLGSLGYSAYAAESGEEAVGCYRMGRACGFPFSAVLLDLSMMSGMGGPETVRRIATIDRDVRAIIMSGNIMHEAVTDFSRHGFRRALLKPFTIDELEAVLSSLLDDVQTASR